MDHVRPLRDARAGADQGELHEGASRLVTPSYLVVADIHVYSYRDVVQHKGSAIKLPEVTGWHLLLTNPAAVDDLRRAPDSVLSFPDAMLEVRCLLRLHASPAYTDGWMYHQSNSIGYTLGFAVFRNPYHVPIVRAQLGRRLGAVFPALVDEMGEAVRDYVPRRDGAWSLRLFRRVLWDDAQGCMDDDRVGRAPRAGDRPAHDMPDEQPRVRRCAAL